MLPAPPRPAFAGLPDTYVAVKFYSGVALPDSPFTRSALCGIVESIAAQTPVVLLDTGLAVDDHGDYAFAGIPNVVSARSWMTPQTNLGVQTALIANASRYVGTCGGLAWMAPFFGVPTVAVYSDDRLLGPHLMLARQAAGQVGAADFMPLDLRALGVLGAAPR
jgi:ADP-heptose:LPS heptosyltransferase